MVKHIAEVRGGVVVKAHQWADDAVVASHKLSEDGGAIFRPLEKVTPPAFEPATHKLNLTYQITQTLVTEVWSTQAKTTQEISGERDIAVASLNGSIHKALVKAIQLLVNDNRRVKRKINAIITQQGISATVPLFPAAQTTSPADDLTVQQVVDAIRAHLDA